MSSTQKKHGKHFSHSQWRRLVTGILKASRLQLFTNSSLLDCSICLIPFPSHHHYPSHCFSSTGMLTTSLVIPNISVSGLIFHRL